MRMSVYLRPGTMTGTLSVQFAANTHAILDGTAESDDVP